MDIFKGCHCVDGFRKVEWGPAENQFASRVFDAHNNLGTDSQWWYTNSSTGGAESLYLVRLKLGRYQSSTGNYEWGEEQRYQLVVA